MLATGCFLATAVGRRRQRRPPRRSPRPPRAATPTRANHHRGAHGAPARRPEVAVTFLTTAEGAKNCRFETTGAIRKALMEKRLRSVCRRSGRGTHVFLQEDLDQFTCGLPPRGNEEPERPGAPPPGSDDEEDRMGQAVELLDRAQTSEAGGMAQEGGGVLRSRTRRRSEGGQDAGGAEGAPGDGGCGRVGVAAEGAVEGSSRGRRFESTADALERLRRVVSRTAPRDEEDQDGKEPGRVG